MIEIVFFFQINVTFNPSVSEKDTKINEENLLDQLFFYQVSYQENKHNYISKQAAKEENFNKLMDKLFLRLRLFQSK